MAADVITGFLHYGDGKTIGLTGRNPTGVGKNPARKSYFDHGLGHSRTDCIDVAGKQDGADVTGRVNFNGSSHEASLFLAPIGSFRLQHTNQREQTACRVKIGFHLAIEARLQQLGTLVVQSAAAHINGLNLRW